METPGFAPTCKSVLLSYPEGKGQPVSRDFLTTGTRMFALTQPQQSSTRTPSVLPDEIAETQRTRLRRNSRMAGSGARRARWPFTALPK